MCGHGTDPGRCPRSRNLWCREPKVYETRTLLRILAPPLIERLRRFSPTFATALLPAAQMAHATRSWCSTIAWRTSSRVFMKYAKLFRGRVIVAVSLSASEARGRRSVGLGDPSYGSLSSECHGPARRSWPTLGLQPSSHGL
jgi:hypothetical protein